MHRCGAQVESLDVEACAISIGLLERFIRRREDEQDVHVLVDVGARRSHVVIGRLRDQLHEADRARFGAPARGDQQEAGDHRRRTCGGLRRRLIEGAEEAGDARGGGDAAPGSPGGHPGGRPPHRNATPFDRPSSTPPEAPWKSLRRNRAVPSLLLGHLPRAAAEQGSIARGEASDPQLLGVLNAVLSVPVEAARPLFSIDYDRMDRAERRGTMSEWAAFGLSLRADDGPLRAARW